MTSPCETCPECRVKYGCRKWKDSFLQRQEQINAYAKSIHQPEPVDVAQLRLHPDEYRHWLLRGPCKDCGAENVCDTPCPAYWRWWDARMGWFRRSWNA